MHVILATGAAAQTKRGNLPMTTSHERRLSEPSTNETFSKTKATQSHLESASVLADYTMLRVMTSDDALKSGDMAENNLQVLRVGTTQPHLR